MAKKEEPKLDYGPPDVVWAYDEENPENETQCSREFYEEFLKPNGWALKTSED